MERWLGLGLLLVVAGLLGALLVVLLGMGERGIALYLSGPIEIQGATGPQELRVVLSLEGPIEVQAGGQAEASLRTTLEGIPCPGCEEGVMVPVKWNPFTGELTWRCPRCGYTTGQAP
ncbi:MAG: hypothetical protein XD60_0321 [Acetothermia bacterium 64_32]|nr:MAG: hypothetical protein XD60_0321 [Acetothermia bacterium 64_32]MBC7099224.1 hypothetical protein [Candidatus Bipolaricaulota bacterium]HAF70057.1 hypothetical protein [Candidatus Acetothermia bacterium]